MSTLKSSAEDLTLNADGSGNDVIIQSDGSTVAIIDSNKNLILGATAKTAHASYNLIQGNNYTLTEDVTAGASKATTWCYNAYTDAGNAWTYMNSDEASNIQQYNGQVTIATAGAGSAEGDVTFINKLTVANAGDVTIGTGDLIFGTAGKGIVLGATSNTDANTLDDYEEGTFTPKLKTPVDATYTTQVGYYTKIGNVVNIWGTLTINSIGSASSGSLDGLPFSVSSDASSNGGWFTTYVGSLNKTAGAYVAGQIVSNTDRIDVFEHSTAAGVASMTAAKYSNGGEMYFYGNYRV